MFDVGFWELALLGAVALIIIGPERLPGAAHTAGLWIGKGRRMLRDIKADIDRELREQTVADLDDLKKDIEDAGGQFKAAADDIGTSMDAKGMSDSLKKSFRDASPPVGDDRPEAAKTQKQKPNRETVTEQHAERYYVYENHLHKQATIHIGSCGHCNEGRGKRGGFDPKRAEWHGPFDDLQSARDRQKTMSVKKKTECRSCIDRTLL